MNRALRMAAMLVLASACCAANLRAQTGAIRGSVADEAGAPLVGVNLVVKGTLLGGASDLHGRFVVDRVPAGEWTVRCSMIGYRSLDTTILVQPGQESEIHVILQESVVATGEVLVTAGRRPQSFEQIPVSVSVVEAREIEARGITVLDQALRYIPGVNVAEDQVNIRGSSGYSRALGSRVLLLIDGAPMLAGDAGEIKFDAVPMFAVERIEVVKGAGSALYGSSALGGVINIITREPRAASLRARVYSGLFDNPSRAQWKWWGASPRWFNGVDVQYGDVMNGFYYVLGGGLRNNQSHRQHDDDVRWNGNASAGYRFDSRRSLRIDLNTASNDHGNWVYWRDLDHALNAPENADLTERIRSDKLQASLLYRETVSSTFAFHARGSMYRTDFETHSDTSDFSTRPTDQTQSTSTVYGAEWQGNWTPHDRHLVTFGADGSYTTVVSRTYGDRYGINGALFAQDEIRLFDDWTVSLGARADLTGIDGDTLDGQFNPRIGTTYTPRPGTVLRASWGRGFRSPSIAERYATASAGGLLTKPNPHLLAERSSSYEVGVKQVLPFAVVDAALFLGEYNNLVEPVIDASDGRIVFRNITRAEISGAEISIQAVPLPGTLEATLGYTYLYPRDVTLNTILKYRPRHLFYVSGTVYAGPLAVSADYRFINRIEEIDRELALVIPDADQRVASHVLDARVRWSGHLDGAGLTVSLIANNVLNYNYVEVPANLAPIRNYRVLFEVGL